MNWGPLDLLLISSLTTLSFLFVRKDLARKTCRSAIRRGGSWFYLLVTPVLYSLLRIGIWTRAARTDLESLRGVIMDGGESRAVAATTDSRGLDVVARMDIAITYLTLALFGVILLTMVAWRIATAADEDSVKDERVSPTENPA